MSRCEPDIRICGSFASAWVGVNHYKSIFAKETVTWGLPNSITSHPEKGNGTCWYFPSMKTMAFAWVIKAPVPIASPHCGLQGFSSLQSKNPSEWWGFDSVYGEWWLFHFAPLCHLGMLTHYQLLKNRLNITFFFWLIDWLKKDRIWKWGTDIYFAKFDPNLLTILVLLRL